MKRKYPSSHAGAVTPGTEVEEKEPVALLVRSKYWGSRTENLVSQRLECATGHVDLVLPLASQPGAKVSSFGRRETF